MSLSLPSHEAPETALSMHEILHIKQNLLDTAPHSRVKHTWPSFSVNYLFHQMHKTTKLTEKGTHMGQNKSSSVNSRFCT